MADDSKDRVGAGSNSAVEIEDAGDLKAASPEQITPRAIQSRFDTLRDLSDGEMTALNKKVLSKLDWRLLPIITIMYLMAYVIPQPPPYTPTSTSCS